MKGVFILALVLCLAGCATTPDAVPFPKPVLVSPPASLDFILVTTGSALPETMAETQLLNDHIISSLRETGLFAKVSDHPADGNAPGGIKVAVQIRQIVPVTANSRDWLGALAGQARVVAQVTISDLASGKLIETFAVEGCTAKTAVGGTTDEAIQRAAARVASEVIKLNALTDS